MKTVRTAAFIERAISEAQQNECWEWPFAKNQYGYGLFQLQKKTIQAHRYVCLRVHGDPPTPKHEAAHRCNRRDCINPFHLRWATKSENESDKLAHGTHTRGTRNGRSKLSESEVLEIRRLCSMGVVRTSIAVAHGVSLTAVRSIEDRKIWAWLDPA